MSRTDIAGVERKVRASYRNDGVTLIVAGVSLAFMAIFFYHQKQAWATTVAVGVWVWLAESLRRRLVYPRLGYAKLAAEKSRAKAPLAMLTVVAVFLGAALVARSLLPHSLSVLGPGDGPCWDRNDAVGAGSQALPAADRGGPR